MVYRASTRRHIAPILGDILRQYSATYRANTRQQDSVTLGHGGTGGLDSPQAQSFLISRFHSHLQVEVQVGVDVEVEVQVGVE